MNDLPAYERDPRATELDVEVLATGEDGGRPWATLSDTVLYPEGGGQPADRGTLRAHGSDVSIVDVQKREGAIRHYLAAPVERGPAHLHLDWSRRFDHMQQHTAQHLLSALAADRFGWETTSFHLGASTCDVELAAASLAADGVAALEEAIAAEVRAARPVGARRVSPDAMSGLRVRSRGLPAGHIGDVRLVEIEGIDLNTCGGTHLRSTAEIECVKLLGSEPMRGGTRLHFVAGGRVRARLAADEARNEALRRALETSDEELVSVVASRLSALQESERARRRLLELLAEVEVARLRAAAATSPFVDAHYEEGDGAFLQRVASAFAASDGEGVALLTAPASSGGVYAVAAQPAATANVEALAKRVAAALDGRGGGRGRIFQGKAGSLAARAELVSALRGELAP